MQARARGADPATSHEAAIRVERKGKAASQREQLASEVRLYPGLTAAEYARILGMERHVPSRRLPELREAGIVKNGWARECSVMKTSCMTWWPCESGKVIQARFW
jgi:hypothetical protein